MEVVSEGEFSHFIRFAEFTVRDELAEVKIRDLKSGNEDISDGFENGFVDGERFSIV